MFGLIKLNKREKAVVKALCLDLIENNLTSGGAYTCTSEIAEGIVKKLGKVEL